MPVEIEYKAWWAVKQLNLDMCKASLKRLLDINELEELRNDAYLNSKIAKDKLKMCHDQLIARKHFQKGDQVLLYDSTTPSSTSFQASLNQDGLGHSPSNKFTSMVQ